MESLLSLAFENLSSRDTTKARKGLRQIEGLLVQICLPSAAHSSPTKARLLVTHQENSQSLQPRSLDALAQDPAFQVFYSLQDHFEWNVATRLIESLDRLLGLHTSREHHATIQSATILLQGVLLLHPPSRALFNREKYMSLILDLLDPSHVNPQTTSATLTVLNIALLDRPQNTRLFEKLDGIGTLTSLLRIASNIAEHSEVRARCVDCLSFYVMPESPVPSLSTSNATASATAAAVSAQPASMMLSNVPVASPVASQHSSIVDVSPSSSCNTAHRLPGDGSVGISSTKSNGSYSTASTSTTSISGSSSDYSYASYTRPTHEKWRLLQTYLGNAADVSTAGGGLGPLAFTSFC